MISQSSEIEIMRFSLSCCLRGSFCQVNKGLHREVSRQTANIDACVSALLVCIEWGGRNVFVPEMKYSYLDQELMAPGCCFEVAYSDLALLCYVRSEGLLQ
jgi:hypothetical protein